MASPSQKRQHLLRLALLGVFGAAVCCYFHLAAGLVTLVTVAVMLLSFHRFEQSQHSPSDQPSDDLETVAAALGAGRLEPGALEHLSKSAADILETVRAYAAQISHLQRESIYRTDITLEIAEQVRAPLASVTSLIEACSAPGLSPARREELSFQVLSGLQRIQWLMAALLKFASLDAGTVDYHLAKVLLRNVVADAVAPLRLPMEINGQTFVLRCEEDLLLTTDPRWLAEALENLLRSCVEYSSRGSQIEIVCSQTSRFTQVEIVDKLSSFSPADLPRLFDSFYTGKNASEGQIGIGLALAKHIVVHMGGELSAESLPGTGAVFRIRLSLQTHVAAMS